MKTKHGQSLDFALAISEALDIALDHPDRRLDPVMSRVLLAYIKEGCSIKMKRSIACAARTGAFAPSANVRVGNHK